MDNDYTDITIEGLIDQRPDLVEAIIAQHTDATSYLSSVVDIVRMDFISRHGEFSVDEFTNYVVISIGVNDVEFDILISNSDDEVLQRIASNANKYIRKYIHDKKKLLGDDEDTHD